MHLTKVGQHWHNSRHKKSGNNRTTTNTNCFYFAENLMTETRPLLNWPTIEIETILFKNFLFPHQNTELLWKVSFRVASSSFHYILKYYMIRQKIREYLDDDKMTLKIYIIIKCIIFFFAIISRSSSSNFLSPTMPTQSLARLFHRQRLAKTCKTNEFFTHDFDEKKYIILVHVIITL